MIAERQQRTASGLTMLVVFVVPFVLAVGSVIGNADQIVAWAVNERDARLAVRILELPTTSGETVELKVAD